MKYFILEQLFFISIGVIAYVIIRKLPQIRGFDDNIDIVKTARKGAFIEMCDNWASILDQKTASSIEKVLRKTKIILMRMDNYVSRHLKRITPSNDDGGNIKPNDIFDNNVNEVEDMDEKK